MLRGAELCARLRGTSPFLRLDVSSTPPICRGLMKFDSPDYEFPIAGSAWTHRVELGAGIYYLDGSTHVAGHGSAAEHDLLHRGALLIARLHFEQNPYEGRQAGRTVRAMSIREAALRLVPALARS